MRIRKPLLHYTSPQELLQERMQADGMDAEELAVRGLLPISLSLQLVAGVVPITDEVAVGLARATGIDSEVWTLLERRYEAGNPMDDDATDDDAMDDDD